MKKRSEQKTKGATSKFKRGQWVWKGASTEYLRSILDYDSITGIFRWKAWRGGSALASSLAGSIGTGGYRRISIRHNATKKLYAAHRLAWLYMTDEWPPDDIDHKNLNRDDNRFENLRLATRPQNIANTKVRRDNKAKLRGVTQCPEGFMARLTFKGERKYLGFFRTAEEAHSAYISAAREAYGEYHRV